MNKLLGRHILLGIWSEPRHAEVVDPYSSIRSEDQIRRLNVMVYDSLVVCIVECLEQLRFQANSVFNWNTNAFFKVSALDIFCGYEDQFLFLAVFIDFDDSGMVQAD